MILPYVAIDSNDQKIEFAGPVTVKLPLDRVDLSTLPEHVTVLHTGYGAPFSLLPDRIIALLLTTESDALAHSKVRPGGLWVGDWWDPRLIEICQDLQIPSIISPRVTTSGTLRRFHSTRPGYSCEEVPLSAFQPVSEDLPPGPAHITPRDDTARLDPDLVLLRRSFHRAMSRIPDRPGVATLAALPAAVSGDAYAATGTNAERLNARRGLLALRNAMDKDRRRGDAWGRLRRVDWDGDGLEEIEMETSQLLVMCDPETASLPTVADKTDLWPVSSIGGDAGWMLARHVSDLEQESPTPIILAVERLEESRSRLTLTLENPELTVRLRIQERTMTIEMEAHGLKPGLLGPELTLQLDATQMRADGSEWTDLTEPTAQVGHKFRLKDGNHQVLIVSPTPATLFVRPAVGGLVVWAHWHSDGTSHHELAVSFDG